MIGKLRILDRKVRILDGFHKMFPDFKCLFIFVSYIALFCAHGLLVTATQNKATGEGEQPIMTTTYDYNPATVVLLGELCKLLVSLGLSLAEHSPSDVIDMLSRNMSLAFKYIVPAILYCIYNNLTFVSLSHYDPATYFILMQFRVVVTGVLFQAIFGKCLTRSQWFSLLILTLGCLVRQASLGDVTGVVLDTKLVTVAIQVFCSCMAGVYNEFLLKSGNLPVSVQNLFFYADSLLCNLFWLGANGNVFVALNFASIQKTWSFYVACIVLNTTCMGLCTSFFLRYLDSIMKNFASGLELIFTPLLAKAFFGIPISYSIVLSVMLILIAIYLYSRNPVKNKVRCVSETVLDEIKSDVSHDK